MVPDKKTGWGAVEYRYPPQLLHPVLWTFRLCCKEMLVHLCSNVFLAKSVLACDAAAETLLCWRFIDREVRDNQWLQIISRWVGRSSAECQAHSSPLANDSAFVSYMPDEVNVFCFYKQIQIINIHWPCLLTVFIFSQLTVTVLMEEIVRDNKELF